VAIRDTQDCLLFEVPTLAASKVRDSQDSLLFEIPFTPVIPITYPISPPAIAGIGPQDFQMALQNLVGENVSPFTFGEQEQLWPGDMFTIDATLPPMLLAQAEQWISFLNSLFGKYGYFLMGDYNRLTPQGPMSGTPLVSGLNANGSNVLNIRGAAVSITNWAIAGDYLQVTAFNSLLGFNVQRLYKILQNASTDGSGDVTVNVRPNIRESLSDGTAIVTTNCAGTFRLASNTQPWKIDKNRVYQSISFKAREALLQ
jgi:hypothetical protein